MSNKTHGEFSAEQQPAQAGRVAEMLSSLTNGTSGSQIRCEDKGAYTLIHVRQQSPLGLVRAALKPICAEADERAVVLVIRFEKSESSQYPDSIFTHPTFGLGFEIDDRLAGKVGAPYGAAVRDPLISEGAKELAI